MALCTALLCTRGSTFEKPNSNYSRTYSTTVPPCTIGFCCHEENPRLPAGPLNGFATVRIPFLKYKHDYNKLRESPRLPAGPKTALQQ